MVGEMSVRGNVQSGKYPSGKCQSGICPQESIGRGTVQSETVLQSLNLLNVFFIKTKNKKTEFKDALETLYYYIKEIKPNNEVQ